MRKKFKLFHCAIILLVHLNLVHSAIRDEEINIAAIFQSANVYNPSLAGFEDGVRYANSYILRGMRLKPTITYVTNDDSFEAINSVCQLIQQKSIWAIFTSQSLPINWIIPSIANNLQIPNIQTIWDYSNSKKIFDVDLKTNFTINLYPDASMLSKSYRDWTDSSDIKALTIIYERKEDLIFIKDLLELNSQSNKVRISIKEHITEGSDFKKLLKDSKLKNGDNFILAIPLDKITELVTQADELNLVTEYNKYLITNLDAFTLNYDFLENNNKNITTLSLINVELLKNEPFARFATNYKHDHALMFDAVTTFAKALYQLKNSAHSIQSPVVSCSRSNRAVWKSGQIILNHIKNSMFDGLTGPIMFNENGQRVNFTMRILSIQQYETQYNQTGFWTIDDGVQIARAKQEDVEENLKNMLRTRRTPIKVATMIDRQPYIFPNPVDEEQLRESEFFNPLQNYTGFCVELLDKLKERLGFEYELIVMNTTGSAPLLEEVKQQKADIAIADITITKERQLEVDFTMPFLTLGVAILYSKSTVESKDLFSFMQPFHMKVWLLLGTAILGVSLVMYIISRISPYEWVSSHPCEDEPEEMENQFSLGNCIWFVLGSIMQQGSDLAPRALSTRLLANVWAFFTLIMTSSYTANLAAVLTLSGMEADIKSVEALAKQTKVKYGLQVDGSTHKFFKNSQHPTYQRMFSYMESIEKTEKVYAKDNAEGVKRVINGGYAYLMESITLDFFTNQFCNLTQIGTLLDRKGYGIALKQGSPYTSLFSTAILKLQEEQYLSELRTKWFKSFPAKLRQIKTPFLTECPKLDVASSGAKEMNVTDVGGVIIVMVVGLIIGILFSLAEIWWKAKKIRRDEREPVCTLIWRELRRIFALGGSSTTDNPLLLTKSSSTSNANVAGSNARSSMVPGEDEKTLKSAKQPDLDSNRGDGKRQMRNRSNTGLSKKGTGTTLNSPGYNLSMNTTGLPSVNHRESSATGYSQPFNNSGARDFEENNHLNNSIEMNPISPVRMEPLGGSPIIDPPPGFDNHQTQVKQPYDGQHYQTFSPQAAQFDPYTIRDLNAHAMNGGLHGSLNNGSLINGGPVNGQFDSLSSSANKAKSKSKSPKSRKKPSSAGQPFNNTGDSNSLRRRSYLLTESPIKWPKQNTYEDDYE